MMQKKIVFDALHKLQEVTAQGLMPMCVVVVSKSTAGRPQVTRRMRLLGNLQLMWEILSIADFPQIA